MPAPDDVLILPALYGLRLTVKQRSLRSAPVGEVVADVEVRLAANPRAS